MSDARGRAVFRRFVDALNRRDSYELELADVDRPVGAERRNMLARRLVILQREIDDYQAELSRLDRRLEVAA
jgi:hypothetical protein